jgi:hypothetical protein
MVCRVNYRGHCRGWGPRGQAQSAPKDAAGHRAAALPGLQDRVLLRVACALSRPVWPSRVGAGGAATARGRSYLSSPRPPLRKGTAGQSLAMEQQHPSQASRVTKAAGGQKFSAGFTVLARVICPTQRGTEGPWPQVVRCLPACSPYPACHLRQNVKNGNKIPERPAVGINARESSRPPVPFPAASPASRTQTGRELRHTPSTSSSR